VLLSGAALALLGGLFYMQSEPYLWDAINIHNDSIQRARPRQAPMPSAPGPGGPSATR
jgi:hypothetical protein